MERRFALLEAAVSCGSPTRGSEGAYDALLEAGLPGLLGGAACGLCCDELTVGRNRVNLLGENLHIIGARSIDPPEYGVVERAGAHLYPIETVRERGIGWVLARVLPALAGKRVHISFDVDVLDPAEFSATGYNIPNGLTVAQAEQIIRAVLSTGLTVSFECVEYNPTLDRDGKDLATLLKVFRLVRDLLS